MKIWTKREPNKGYIPSDKVHFRGIPFEITSLSHWGANKDDTLEVIKDKIRQDKTEGIVYLNVNFDGIDCFISR